MPAKFELLRSHDDQYFFNLLDSSGEVLLTSELYKTKKSAEKGIASVQKHSEDEKRYDRRMNRGGQHYFVLRAPNNKIIGTSETYPTYARMEKAVQAVMKHGSNERLKDWTKEPTEEES